MNDIKKYTAEFLGTFALVFIGAGVVLITTLTNGTPGLIGIALAHGLVLMAMIYALSHISGAHFNPAVTIAMLATKRIDVKNAAAYVFSQLLGASIAGLALAALFSQVRREVIYGFPAIISLEFGIPVEAILTFFLVLTIFGVAVDNRAPKGFHGLAIGSVLIFDILFGGVLTGAAMNPARAFGPALASGIWNTQIIYWVGPIIGALVAAFVYEHLLLDKK